MRIVVYGAGALGGYFGAKFQSAGHDVSFVARGAHLEALKEYGLRIESDDETTRLPVVNAVATIAEAGPADLIFFAVKNYDVERAAADLATAITTETAIMTVQNGVSAQPYLAGTFGADRILPGIVRLPAHIKSPGVIRVPAETEMGGLVFGAYCGAPTDSARSVLEAFTVSGADATLSDDIWRSLWEKFIPLSAFSATTTMMRLDIGPVREAPASGRLLRTLIDETAAVARACHPSVPKDAADTAFAFLQNVPPEIHASMLDDLLRGKRLELDWLSGEVVRRGARLGIPTPAHSFTCAVLAPHTAGRRAAGN